MSLRDEQRVNQTVRVYNTSRRKNGYREHTESHLAFAGHFSCSRHPAKRFAGMFSFNPHNGTMWRPLLQGWDHHSSYHTDRETEALVS